MNTTTSTNSSTQTHTVTISSNDVRQVMRYIGADIQAICQAASQATHAFNMDEALVDVSVLLLNGVISGVTLWIEKEGVVVREYGFQFVDAPGGAAGPPAGQPPLGYVPSGARVRLRVTADTRLPVAEREAWFDRLGWKDSEPLTYAQGTTQTTYGSFQSGGLSVERNLKANPAYDRPQS